MNQKKTLTDFLEYLIEKDFIPKDTFSIPDVVKNFILRNYIEMSAETSDVTFVVTCCGRPDLLEKTLDSFMKFNTYPIRQYIVVEDSGKPGIISESLKKKYETLPFVWIENKENIGQIKSIVNAYRNVKTKYVFHCEDDWEFYREGFIEQSKVILETIPTVIQAWLRERNDTNGHPVEKELLTATNMQTGEEAAFSYITATHNTIWHGFSFNPGLKRMSDYIPYDLVTKYLGKKDSGAECQIGEHYFKKGYRAVILHQGYIRHTGWTKTTRIRAMVNDKTASAPASLPHDETIWSLNTAKAAHQYSPSLAGAMASLLPKQITVIDFGCGKGSYIKHLSDNGYKCYGFEGTPGINTISDFKGIVELDLSVPFTSELKGNVLCLEVAEHIPKEFEDVFIANIIQCVDNLLILSWALKGQGGHGHHNEQNSDYVIPLMQSHGFTFDQKESLTLREFGGKELWWFQNSIYVFRR